MLFLVGATYAWTQRNTFAQDRRRGFEKQGWEWAARLVKDDMSRRIAIFFAIFWAVVGIALVVTSFVLFVVPG